MSEIGTIDAIARALTADLPSGWREVTALFRATTSYSELDVTMVGPGGEPTQLESLPDGLKNFFETLRQQMYQPGKGAWLTARIAVTADGHFSTDFDYDHEPDWSISVDAGIYAADLAEFPRDDQHIPSWLR